MLLPGALGISLRAGADDVWSHMLRRKDMGPALRAMREVDIGDVHDPVVAPAPAAYRGCDEPELQFRTLEALVRRLQDIGL